MYVGIVCRCSVFMYVRVFGTVIQHMSISTHEYCNIISQAQKRVVTEVHPQIQFEKFCQSPVTVTVTVTVTVYLF